MGIIDWQCCSCRHQFKGHQNKCPKCGHWISAKHLHLGNDFPRRLKKNIFQKIIERLGILWYMCIGGLRTGIHHFLKRD